VATISEALAIAILHHKAGRLHEAQQIYRQILALDPNHADALYLFGMVAQHSGKHEVAVEYICRAVELKGDVALFHHSLGDAHRGLGRLVEAVACYRRALALKPHVAEAHNSLGVVLNSQGKPKEAIACYCRALEINPAYADANHNLGDALEQMGDLCGAENCFRSALRYNPRLAQAHGKLARLLGGRLPENDLIALRSLLEESCLTNAQRWTLHFGLAHVLDARGEYVEAAMHLDRAKALQVDQWQLDGLEYDPQAHEIFVTRTIQAHTPDFFQRVRGFGLESAAPVFVFGLPRSGTTLVEQILASHSQVVGAGEISLVGDTVSALAEPVGDFIDSLGQLDRPTAQHVAARHLERLCAAGPAALHVIDKTPEN
jgi:Tfp pilus assembly protein PilF